MHCLLPCHNEEVVVRLPPFISPEPWTKEKDTNRGQRRRRRWSESVSEPPPRGARGDEDSSRPTADWVSGRCRCATSRTERSRRRCPRPVTWPSLKGEGGARERERTTSLAGARQPAWSRVGGRPDGWMHCLLPCRESCSSWNVMLARHARPKDGQNPCSSSSASRPRSGGGSVKVKVKRRRNGGLIAGAQRWSKNRAAPPVSRPLRGTPQSPRRG